MSTLHQTVFDEPDAALTEALRDLDRALHTAGVAVERGGPTMTSNPGSHLVLTVAPRLLAQVILWSSGECTTQFIDQDISDEIAVEQHLVRSQEELNVLLAQVAAPFLAGS